MEGIQQGLISYSKEAQPFLFPSCSMGSLSHATLVNNPTMNQHPPAHHPLDAPYYSVVDESHLSPKLVSP
jgi:hypothetical protein